MASMLLPRALGLRDRRACVHGCSRQCCSWAISGYHSCLFGQPHPDSRACKSSSWSTGSRIIAVAYLAGLPELASLRQVGVELRDKSGELENLQALHDNIIQSISAGLITTGLEGGRSRQQIRADRFLERSESELIGTSITSLSWTRCRIVASAPVHAEVRMRTPGG